MLISDATQTVASACYQYELLLSEKEVRKVKRRGFLKLLGASPVVAVPEFPRFAAQTGANQPIAEVQAHRPERMPDLTFDNFVVGDANRRAYEASVHAATHLGYGVEPLHICGNCGLGKTHLLYAIAHHVRQTQPGSRIYIDQAERFIGGYIKALRNGRADEFRQNILSFDILLLDDLQYLAGKDVSQTQTAWFLNRSVSAGPSVVTADVLSLYALDWNPWLRVDRARASVRISPPEPETSLKILRQQTDHIGIEVPDDVAGYLVGMNYINDGDTRCLIGSLNRLRNESSFTGRPISLDFAEERGL